MQRSCYGLKIDTKRLDAEGDFYVVEGYASIFGNVDLGGDIVERGAFTESLGKRMPLFLYGHDQSQPPIGVVLEAIENDRGLWFQARMPKDDDFVKGRIRPQLRVEGLKGVSIGYRTLVASNEDRDGERVRIIRKAELYEISLVNLPMNPAARVENFKTLSVEEFDRMTEREREARLKAHGLSTNVTKRLLAGLRDAGDGNRRDAGSEEKRNQMAGLPDLAATIRQFAEGL